MKFNKEMRKLQLSRIVSNIKEDIETWSSKFSVKVEEMDFLRTGVGFKMKVNFAGDEEEKKLYADTWFEMKSFIDNLSSWLFGETIDVSICSSIEDFSIQLEVVSQF